MATGINDSAYKILIIIMASDGSFESQSLVSGFSAEPRINDIIITDDLVVYLTKSFDNTDSSSVLIKFDTKDNTLAVYEKSNTWYGGFSRGSLGGFYYLGAGDNNAKELIVIKASNLEGLTRYEDEASGYTVASTTAYTDNSSGSTGISVGSEQTNRIYAVASSDGSDSTSERSQIGMRVNVWVTATDEDIQGNVTGGTVTPQCSCFVDDPSITEPEMNYSLLDGSGSVPSWISIDSST